MNLGVSNDAFNYDEWVDIPSYGSTYTSDVKFFTPLNSSESEESTNTTQTIVDEDLIVASIMEDFEAAPSPADGGPGRDGGGNLEWYNADLSSPLSLDGDLEEWYKDPLAGLDIPEIPEYIPPGYNKAQYEEESRSVVKPSEIKKRNKDYVVEEIITAEEAIDFGCENDGVDLNSSLRYRDFEYLKDHSHLPSTLHREEVQAKR